MEGGIAVTMCAISASASNTSFLWAYLLGLPACHGVVRVPVFVGIVLASFLEAALMA